MNKPLPENPAEAVALQRYALITKIQELLHQQIPLSVALERVVAPSIITTDTGEFLIAKRTLEDWWYTYKKGGFTALYPKARSDRGKPRALTPEQQSFVLDQVRAQLAVPVKVLYRHWKVTDPTLPALSSIYRWLDRHDLDQKARRYQTRQSLSGPTKAFEAPAVNDLWMVDFSPGPFLTIPDQKKALATHHCAILDDHSRLIVSGHYHALANTQSFHFTLKEGLRRRGVPHTLYTDQGGPFTNDHTRLVCARLGIRLLHARPYHSWSKGKVERYFRTCHGDFEVTLRLPGQSVHSLDALNGRWADWVESVYHARVHSSTDQTPQERFARGARLVRSLDSQVDLDRLFYAQVERLVRKDGTVRLDTELYEVDLSLRGLKVSLRFDPWTRARVEVEYRGQSFGLARRVDLHLNSQLPGGRP